MLEKLLSLLLHAKSGAVATVFVLGTTGALVTATVENGMTTVTITQATSSTDGSTTTPTTPTTPTTTTTTTTVDQAILALFTRTSAEHDPTSTAKGKGCSDERHAIKDEIKRVNEHSKSTREEVRELRKDAPRTDAARELVHDADKAIKDIRKAAGKAIRATFDCDKHDDDVDVDDVDEGDVDEDETSTTTDPSVVFTDDNAEAIAEEAINLMDGVVAGLEAALEDLEEPTPTTNTRQSNGKSDNDKNDNKGKGKGKDNGRHGDDDDKDDD